MKTNINVANLTEAQLEGIEYAAGEVLRLRGACNAGCDEWLAAGGKEENLAEYRRVWADRLLLAELVRCEGELVRALLG
jgi:hypothetical protein